MKKTTIFLIKFSTYACLFFNIAFPIIGWSAETQPLGAIATQHPLASQSAAEILKKGGNAIDAAIAAALTLAVVEPYNSGLGGGGMALVWNAQERKVHAIDFREKAPLAANSDMYQKNDVPEDASRVGPLAIAVPGEVAGLEWIHQQWGKLAWSELFTQAIHDAENGIVLNEHLKKRVEEKQECLSRDYDSYQVYRQAFLSEEKGKPPQKKLWKQQDLAQTLKKIQDHGAKEFYQGEIAVELIRNLRAKGAILSLEDLKNYQVIEREPLFTDFAWGKLWGAPPPTSGGISVLHGMNLLEALSKGKPERLHENWQPWLIATFAQIFEDRNTLMGDPDFIAEMPIKKWISKKEAKREAGDILKAEGSSLPVSSTLPSPGHTTHLSIIDGEGNAVSMTLTLNLSFGSCVTAGKTGVLMNDQMDDFATAVGQPNAFGLTQSSFNAIAPGKRPLSSISPTLVTQKEKVILALGSPGGPRIITTILQTLARYFILKENLSEAIAASRLHYQGESGNILLEGKEAQKPWSDVQSVSFDPATGKFEAVSDPRGQGKGMIVY